MGTMSLACGGSHGCDGTTVDMSCLAWNGCHSPLGGIAANPDYELPRRAGIFSASSYLALTMRTELLGGRYVSWKQLCTGIHRGGICCFWPMDMHAPVIPEGEEET